MSASIQGMPAGPGTGGLAATDWAEEAAMESLLVSRSGPLSLAKPGAALKSSNGSAGGAV